MPRVKDHRLPGIMANSDNLVVHDLVKDLSDARDGLTRARKLAREFVECPNDGFDQLQRLCDEVLGEEA